MDEHLKKLKLDLDAEIRKTKDLDDISREKLDKLLSYLDTKMQTPNDPENHDQLIGHLEDSIHYFEATHADLTMAMNNLLTMLSNLGI
jgi:Domain of unknown function (DUF4404)